MTIKHLPVFISCPKGLEYLVEAELGERFDVHCKMAVAGVSVELTQAQVYEYILWSRLANRVLLVLAEGNVASAEDVYALANTVEWNQHIDSNATLAVDFSGTNDAIRNTNFGAVTVKDAIVDQVRDEQGRRPTVSKLFPDIRVNVRLHRNHLTVCLDLSGDSLHRRGYRSEAGEAPMKENLAAAILLRAGWPKLAEEGRPLFDPMCGSGTILIEAAMMACHKAPALDREYFGFSAWKQHDPELWSNLLNEAKARFSIGLKRCRSAISGSDMDEKVLSVARRNIKRGGLDSVIRVSKCTVEALNLNDVQANGLLISNPPYGERLGELEQLKTLYAALGEKIKRYLQGWQAALFTSNPQLCKEMALRSHKQYKLFNGPLPSQLLLFDVEESNFQKRNDDFSTADRIRWCEEKFGQSERALMFGNRLKKNNKRLLKWAKKADVHCYRVYDADMPEFALAIDRYEDWVHVQEYEAPPSIDAHQSKTRLNEALSQLSSVLDVSPEKVVLKQRRRQKGKDQYEKQANQRHRLTVREHGAQFYVNLMDYLDTGLFLDHRPIRQWVQQNARNKSFLNLFCYTATASVHAAVGGAVRTTSVDMSNTYLKWGQDNFNLNRLAGNHEFVQADCLTWLAESNEKYDLIFMDPPTFSNSKRMEGTLDIQRDHVELLHRAMKLLKFDGVLVFSNNHRRFKLDEKALSNYQIENISAKTIGEDFQRNSRIHQCWILKHQWNAEW